MRKHLLAIAVILTVATGCDNVAWGGIEYGLEGPPSADTTSGGEAGTGTPDEPENYDGPLLLAGSREGLRATLVVVGEVHPDGLRSFPDPVFPGDTARLERMTAPGSEWVLFSEGVRVGRLVTDGADLAAGYCGGRTRVSGVVELVPSAAAAERLLALPEADAGDRPYEEYQMLSDVYDQRVATLSMANDAIPRYGAQWPAPGVLDARDHLQAFQLRNASGPAIAATFMYQDELTVASPGPGAYSLFVIGEQVDGAYRETYAAYRAVEAGGKGAPRYFDHLDWDGDGSDEILLDVFGADRRWFTTLSPQDGTWVPSFRDPCGS